MLHLTMKEVVQAARKEFDAGTLQLQTEGDSYDYRPSYRGPCAIGAAMPAHLRQLADTFLGEDDYPDIYAVTEAKIVAFPDEYEEADAKILQSVHDEGFVEAFKSTLEYMEEKYATA